MVYANELALKHKDVLSEIQVDILEMARKIAQVNLEKENEEDTGNTEPPTTNSV